ncbi:MAG: hypothetical protein LUO79_07615 [Methanomassiliicoccales archaeon]|nr:hypothetical protein [Methanomassiliicoccales archaeon]
MQSLYVMFDEIDEEMIRILDTVSEIREMVEKGQKKKALETLVALENEMEEFLTFPEDEDEVEEGMETSDE